MTARLGRYRVITCKNKLMTPLFLDTHTGMLDDSDLDDFDQATCLLILNPNANLGNDELKVRYN